MKCVQYSSFKLKNVQNQKCLSLCSLSSMFFFVLTCPKCSAPLCFCFGKVGHLLHVKWDN